MCVYVCVPESDWYRLWRGVYQEGLQRLQSAGTRTTQFVCEICHQEFQRKGHC